MAQETLVEMQIADGRRLIDRLLAGGVGVTAAGWVKESLYGQWYLYLATPLVSEAGGTLSAYQHVNEVIRGIPEPLLVDPFEIKVVSPGSPVGKGLSELQKRPSGASVIRVGSGMLGDLNMDAAYSYPLVPASVG